MTKVSIAIPTWEAYGRGREFLDDLLSTIQIQTLKDYEVIVSDHSEYDELKDLSQEYVAKGMNVKYVRNKEKRGNGPANTNVAIDLCKGEIVKVMFQDDFFYDDEALEKIYNSLTESDKSWLVCGCNHTQTDGKDFYWTLMPNWNPNILKGVNTISSPSVLAFKNGKVKERFDEDVTMMMDCEMYYRLDKIHGQPVYLHDDLISNRVHNEQISREKYNGEGFTEFMRNEIRYCYRKHNLHDNMKEIDGLTWNWS